MIKECLLPYVTDWYGELRYHDYWNEMINQDKMYYLVEAVKGHVDVVCEDDIETYLDLEQWYPEGTISQILDNIYGDCWSLETPENPEEE